MNPQKVIKELLHKKINLPAVVLSLVPVPTGSRGVMYDIRTVILMRPDQIAAWLVISHDQRYWTYLLGLIIYETVYPDVKTPGRQTASPRWPDFNVIFLTHETPRSIPDCLRDKFSCPVIVRLGVKPPSGERNTSLPRMCYPVARPCQNVGLHGQN